MAAAAAEKRKRLPKELQEYKKELKNFSFQKKLKAYFDCSPFQSALDETKREIIYKSFSKAEKGKFKDVYIPILLTIDRYGDRVRAIYGNCFIYGFYISTTLRQTKNCCYTADFLNGIIPLTERALEGIRGEEHQDSLEKAIKGLKSYKYTTFNTPKITRGENEKYGVNFDEIEKELIGVIDTLKNLLSQIKCFLEAMKEFLEWIGTPDLFPKEYRDMENGFLSIYQPVDPMDVNGESAKGFPLATMVLKAEKEYLSIDYQKLPHTIDVFGENNIWIEYYKGRYGRK